MHAPIRDEDLLPCEDSKSTPRSMSTVERNPQVPGPTPHKVLATGTEGRGFLSGLRALSRGLAFPEATREGP